MQHKITRIAKPKTALIFEVTINNKGINKYVTATDIPHAI